MNHPILDRYSRTEDGAIVIEVTTEKVEDLYNNFDRNAPYIKKDLDDELSEYLVQKRFVNGLDKPEVVMSRIDVFLLQLANSRNHKIAGMPNG